MQLIRRYHRAIRALLLVILTAGLLMAWRGFINPNLLQLETVAEFVTVFGLLALAAFLTRILGHFVAPPPPGEMDEDTDQIEPAPAPAATLLDR